MPLYEYQCESCGRRFERIQKFSDPLVETCPTCGGKVHKLLSSPAFHLKGTGWYATDYSGKDKGSAPDADKGESASASTAGDADNASKDSKQSKDAQDSKASKDSQETKTSADSGGAKPAAAPSSKESTSSPGSSKS